MSPKDLCTISFLDKILATGVSVLKIEGRGRGAEYVKTTVRCYREAIQSVQEGTYTKDKIESWIRDLRSVYNRDFWDGYYLGKTVGEWTTRYGSQAQKIKVHIGKITNYFSNLNVAEIKIETQDLQLGDTVIISGPTTGVYETVISEIRVDLKPVEKAEKGVFCSVPVQDTVRRNDKVYKWIDNPNQFE